MKHHKRFCTICGKSCQLTIGGYSQWGRHVYGLLAEPRCSQECAGRPVVDVEAQRTLERMGDYVVAARLAGIQPMSPARIMADVMAGRA